MSRPHSAIRTWAACAWTPGIVHSSLMISACGARTYSIRSLRFFSAVSSASIVREQLSDHDPVVLDLEAALEGFSELRNLGAHPALGELGELRGIGNAGEQRFEHRAGGLGVGGRRDA